MAEIAVSPVQIASNARGLAVEFANTQFADAPLSLALIFGGANTVSPNSNSANQFTFSMPRFTNKAKAIIVKTKFTAKVISANTVRVELNPAIHLFLNEVQTIPAASTILFDGRGARNEFLPVDGEKFTGLDTLSKISIGQLSVTYGFNNSDFSTSALYAPSLVTNNLIVYMGLSVHVQY